MVPVELLATVPPAPPVPLDVVLLLELPLVLLRVLLEPEVFAADELCVPVTVLAAVPLVTAVFVSVEAVSVLFPLPVEACSELLPQAASTPMKQTARAKPAARLGARWGSMALSHSCSLCTQQGLRHKMRAAPSPNERRFRW
jgi:hypothetical protein